MLVFRCCRTYCQPPIADSIRQVVYKTGEGLKAELQRWSKRPVSPNYGSWDMFRFRNNGTFLGHESP